MDLSGKDYLTTAEAAHFCCVSLRQFQRHAQSLGIVPFPFMGKLLYRRHDLIRAIEQCRQSTSAGSRSI